jgi:uncharacterized damage-inducible protein DinB
VQIIGSVTSLLDDMTALLQRDLEGLEQEIALFPDDQSLWATRPGVTNSAGNLALHVAGNLQHFVGRELGGLPYQRNRDDEFGRRSGTRAAVIEEVGRALAAVASVVPRLTDAQLEKPFDAHPGVVISTRRFLLHLCTHTAFHVGQVGYLRRIVTGDPRSTNTVSAGRLGPA